MENTPNPNNSPQPSNHGVMDVHMPSQQAPHEEKPQLPAPPESSHPDHPNKLPSPVQPHQNSIPKLVITLAVLVALSLAAMTVVIYLQGRQQSEPEQETNNPDQTSVQPATAEDVDDTSKTVDKALESTDTAQDLPEDDLSDQTLGL